MNCPNWIASKWPQAIFPRGDAPTGLPNDGISNCLTTGNLVSMDLPPSLATASHIPVTISNSQPISWRYWLCSSLMHCWFSYVACCCSPCACCCSSVNNLMISAWVSIVTSCGGKVFHLSCASAEGAMALGDWIAMHCLAISTTKHACWEV